MGTEYDTQSGSIKVNPEVSPINILQCKFYATLMFEHSDWLKYLKSKSECFNYNFLYRFGPMPPMGVDS